MEDYEQLADKLLKRLDKSTNIERCNIKLKNKPNGNFNFLHLVIIIIIAIFLLSMTINIVSPKKHSELKFTDIKREYREVDFDKEPEIKIENPKVLDKKIENIKSIKQQKNKPLIELMIAARLRESSNVLDTVNTLGFMGWYQFGKSTLKTIGMGHISKDEFLKSSWYQNEAFKRNLKYHSKRLEKYITKYEGKYVGGILITRSGVCMGAHIGGEGAMRDFFDTNGKVVHKDSYNTKVTSYMVLFANYEII